MLHDLIEELREKRSLDDRKLLRLLENNDPETEARLQAAARETAVAQFGKCVWLRALIEWSNRCRNDCYYCGIRRSNRSVRRYSLTQDEILSCCEQAWNLGLRTFVLQGGENPVEAKDLAKTVTSIREAWPEAAITLSLGELSRDTYALLRRCGANRFLLRHETANPSHYARLHPGPMKLESRLECLRTLRELGYQTGMGMMVGSPFQTPHDLLADIRLIESFRPEMIGIGPFIPHRDTPFRDFAAGSTDLTLRLYAILRLMLPTVWMPATTALATLRPDGRTAGILAGANVVMPNFTPAAYRGDYTLYEGKARPDAEAIENLNQLKHELDTIGYHV